MAKTLFYEKLYITIFSVSFIWIGCSIYVSAEDYIRNIKLTPVVSSNHKIRLRMQWESHLQENLAQIIVQVFAPELICVEHAAHDATELYIPFNENPNVENKCQILAGRNYNISIGKTNDPSAKWLDIALPECIDGICDCRLSNIQYLIPNLNVTLYANGTADIRWEISLNQSFGKRTKRTLDEIIRLNLTVHPDKNPPSIYGGNDKITLSSDDPQINIGPLLNGKKKIQGFLSFKGLQKLHGQHLHFKYYLKNNFSCETAKKNYRSEFPQPPPKVPRPLKPVPHPEEEQENTSNSFVHIILGIIVAVILLAIIVLVVRLFPRKRRKMRIIKMMSNLVYNTETPDMHKCDKWEVARMDIKCNYKDELGHGAFGCVFEGQAKNLRTRPGTVTVAIKKLKKHPTREEVEEFLGEIATMKHVGYHENIVELLGCCTLTEPYLMIMEYVGGGNLIQYFKVLRERFTMTTKGRMYENQSLLSREVSDCTMPLQGKYLELKHSSTSESCYIQQNQQSPANLRPSLTETMYTMVSNNSGESFNRNDFYKPIDNMELHNFAYQIAKGMRYLEEIQITHRDLAARNVLIDDRRTLKISDFGLSRTGIYVNTRNRTVPLRWLSIEAIRDHLYSSKSDVWAFGVVLWEIGTLGGFPYAKLANEELTAFLLSGRRLERPEICTEFLYELMLDCWHEDPNTRPSFDTILRRLQNKEIYVDVGSLGPDYVFPPTKEEIKQHEHKFKSGTNTPKS